MVTAVDVISTSFSYSVANIVTAVAVVCIVHSAVIDSPVFVAADSGDALVTPVCEVRSGAVNVAIFVAVVVVVELLASAVTVLVNVLTTVGFAAIEVATVARVLLLFM